MAEKIYQIQLKSPMGPKRGRATIRPGEGQIVLELLGGENAFHGSFAQAYTFEMNGTLRTAVRDLPGVLRGELSAEHLSAVFSTEQGDFPIQGVPEAPSGRKP